MTWQLLAAASVALTLIAGTGFAQTGTPQSPDGKTAGRDTARPLRNGSQSPIGPGNDGFVRTPALSGLDYSRPVGDATGSLSTDSTSLSHGPSDAPVPGAPPVHGLGGPSHGQPGVGGG